MKIILKRNIEKIGQVGDVVEVSDGFARNFLIPQGKAISFTIGNFKHIEYLKKREVEQREGELKEVKELAEKINNISLEIKVKAGFKRILKKIGCSYCTG
jgi:large subunit ribosomal protein L9